MSARCISSNSNVDSRSYVISMLIVYATFRNFSDMILEKTFTHF